MLIIVITTIYLGFTPLFWAAQQNDINLILRLIAHGAQATDTDYNGLNILHHYRDTEIIKLFPSLINTGDCSGKFGIIISVYLMKGEIVQIVFMISFVF